MFTIALFILSPTCGYLIGNILGVAHPEIAAFIGFCLGFAVLLCVPHQLPKAAVEEADDSPNPASQNNNVALE